MGTCKRIGSLALAISSTLCAAAAVAQETPLAEGNDLQLIDTVAVSASRIRIDGYDAPTPVTVIGGDAIAREAKIDVADLIRDLPSFGASASPNNSQNQSLVTAGVAGLNLVSLRNLGYNRNLVLVDGQRVVSSSVQGGVDISTIPSSLVERIEVVTGGASAAWGSDAVAGVVNILINKKFRGIEGHVEASDNFDSNHSQTKYELSWGTDLLDGRASMILSGSYVDTPDEFYSYDIDGFRYQRLVNNPAFVAGNGQPRLIHADNVGLLRATPGGLITSGPLAGIQFVGQAATPERFDSANASRGFYTNGGTSNTSEGDIGLVSAPSRGSTFFALGTFNITERLRASLQLNRGEFYSKTNSWSDIKYGTVVIRDDNPYIPQTILDQMGTLGITTFNLGTMNHIPGRPSLQDQRESLGYTVVEQTRVLERGVFSLEGDIGESWGWSAYYQHGESVTNMNGLNNQQPARYNLAVDAVRVTQANVGASGLPIGAIVCRSQLTEPNNGCAPLNVFGVGNASQDSIDYITEVARHGGQTMEGTLTQKTAALTFQGPLGFGLPAGDLTTAFGIEYREEVGRQVASPAAQASTFQLGNPKNFYGKYDTNEAFLEVNVPLLKDTGVKSLTFDAAGRLTDYSTSGKVETYKLGLTSQIVQDFRLRLSHSLDIRAPTLFNLFSTGLPVTGTGIDPNTGLGVSIFSTTKGNPNLAPEESTTQSIGFVYTPSWLDGLTLSVDYYDIRIEDAISQYNTNVTIEQCRLGNQIFCNNLVFNGPNGALSEVFVIPVNADEEETSGIDVSLDYRAFVGPGALNIALLGNYMFEHKIESLGVPYEFTGAIGQDSRYQGAPQLNATASATYVLGNWSGTAQVRVVGDAELVHEWTALDVDDNKVPSRYYLDLRSSYKFDNGLQIYAALDNVLDKAPPVVAFYEGGSGFETPYTDTYHDGFGRVWRFGLRMKY